MIDDADRAGELEQLHRDESLAAVRRRVAEAMKPIDGADRVHCLDCDGVIDAKRRQALPFAARCTECAEVAEKRMRGGTDGRR